MTQTETFDAELIPGQAPGAELARVVSEGDPEVMLRVLETKAKLAGRMRAAIEHIMVSQTYPQDWTIQGDGDKARACLGSAGAERIARNFPIAFRGVTWKREDFEDASGKGYRYVYGGYASMYDRDVYAEGSYSTRDEFLGKAHGEWRPMEDINEGDIRAAAHHIFMGNAVKALLGLRGLPVAEFNRIMAATGQQAAKAGRVDRTSGAQGGVSPADKKHQAELCKACLDLVAAGYSAERGADGRWTPAALGEEDTREANEIAKDLCERISSFRGKDGKEVRGLTASRLSGKRLEITLSTAHDLLGMVSGEGEAP
ncbi:MAG TPA: hypothetical protein VNA25_25830 [Phycisphaerae bacterium]|nr:hypothetical protein [Phycisphaerae bacterium]